MKLLRDLTPVFCTTDLAWRELRRLHSAVGLPWWCMIAPRGVVRLFARSRT